MIKKVISFFRGVFSRNRHLSLVQDSSKEINQLIHLPKTVTKPGPIIKGK